MTSANDLLFSGGTKAAFNKETPRGTSVSGVITSEPQAVQVRDYLTGDLKTYADGNPVMQIVITLQTELRDDPDDDGQRAVYVKGGKLKTLREAVKKSGASKLERGARLTVTYSHDIKNDNPKLNDEKAHTYVYQSPAAAVLDVEEPAKAADPALAAALANLTPEQRRDLGLPA